MASNTLKPETRVAIDNLKQRAEFARKRGDFDSAHFFLHEAARRLLVESGATAEELAAFDRDDGHA
jgi:hypothetical protein